MRIAGFAELGKPREVSAAKMCMCACSSCKGGNCKACTMKSCKAEGCRKEVEAGIDK